MYCLTTVLWVAFTPMLLDVASFFIKVFIFFDISIFDTYLEKKRNNF